MHSANPKSRVTGQVNKQLVSPMTLQEGFRYKFHAFCPSKGESGSGTLKGTKLQAASSRCVLLQRGEKFQFFA